MFGQQSPSHMRPDMLDNTEYRSQARKYRSKRQRPCDICRQRKSQCKIPGSGGACELCHKLGRSCTFVLQPLKKERWLPPETQSSSAQHRDIHPDSSDPMAIDIGAGENTDLQFNVDVDSQTTTPLSGELPFLGRSDSQAGAIDWSYLNFPICE